jgi:hypothetical protein
VPRSEPLEFWDWEEVKSEIAKTNTKRALLSNGSFLSVK